MFGRVWEGLLVVAGLFLILIFFSEEFDRSRRRLSALLQRRPQLKYLVYPLVAVLLLGAAALVLHTLVQFAGLRFSYD